MPETRNQVVVHHPGGLNMRINHRWPDKLKPALFRVGCNPIRKSCRRRYVAVPFPKIDHGFKISKCPDIPAETPEFVLNLEEPPGIVDRGIDFLQVPDDPGVCHLPGNFGFAIAGNFYRVEITESGPEIFMLFQDSQPTQPSLETLERQKFKQFTVVGYRQAPFPVVITDV